LDGRARWFDLVSARAHKRGLLVFFRGVGDRDTAEALRGAFLTVPAGELPVLPEDSYYVFDLLGSRVNSEDGEFLGRVTDVLSAAGNQVLVVDGTEGGEVLLPMTREVVRRVDLEGASIVVHLLPGLLDSR
jgi:16S rRNA processing protein RimM